MKLYKNQGEYFDIPTQDLTIRQVREKLADLASQVLPPDTIEKFKDLLALKGSPNGGNAVTDDLKYNSTCAKALSRHDTFLSFDLLITVLPVCYQSNSEGRTESMYRRRFF